jgi:6-phosphofructokinase 1
MQKHNIQSLLIIGGFEAFTALLALSRARKMYPAFCIPMVTLPATVSNNVPGTEYSLGSDTALNCIVQACDTIKLSANASRSRVFIVEVQGGKCGYLAVLGGISCGATTTYIPEKGINIDLLQRDIRHLCRRYSEEGEHGYRNAGRIILRTETAASHVYNTDAVSNIFKAEGKGFFDSRTAILGHLQQGGIPSPLDRIRATRLAVACVDWIDKSVAECSDHKACSWMPSVYTDKREHSTCIGVKGAEVVFTPVEDVLKEANMKKRTSKMSWWMELDDFIRVLSKY